VLINQLANSSFWSTLDPRLESTISFLDLFFLLSLFNNLDPRLLYPVEALSFLELPFYPLYPPSCMVGRESLMKWNLRMASMSAL
jgi:hypothetical protein